jgi:hypothetical protein
MRSEGAKGEGRGQVGRAERTARKYRGSGPFPSLMRPERR